MKEPTTSPSDSATEGNIGDRLWRGLTIAVLAIPYLLYVAFVIREGQGPIDYETFMDIGSRLLEGQEVYGTNSYHPMPYVMIFALFAACPDP